MSRTTGRVGIVRDYLARVKTARSPAEIRRAVDPSTPLGVICNTLAYMARCGYVEQLGHGKGRARFRIGTRTPPTAARRANGTTSVLAKHPRQRRAPASNFSAAPGTVADRPAALMTASEQIAADIAAFQARGGKIERLGTTQVFHVVEADNDED